MSSIGSALDSVTDSTDSVLRYVCVRWECIVVANASSSPARRCLPRPYGAPCWAAALGTDSLMGRLKFWKPYQIRDADIDTPLGEKSRYLPSVMSLMVEEVRHGKPERIFSQLRINYARVEEFAAQALLC
jgi:hypothetical protein